MSNIHEGEPRESNMDSIWLERQQLAQKVAQMLELQYGQLKSHFPSAIELEIASDIYARHWIDGPRGEHSQDYSLVSDLRQFIYAETSEGRKEVIWREEETGYGISGDGVLYQRVRKPHTTNGLWWQPRTDEGSLLSWGVERFLYSNEERDLLSQDQVNLMRMRQALWSLATPEERQTMLQSLSE